VYRAASYADDGLDEYTLATNEVVMPMDQGRRLGEDQREVFELAQLILADIIGTSAASTPFALRGHEHPMHVSPCLSPEADKCHEPAALYFSL